MGAAAGGGGCALSVQLLGGFGVRLGSRRVGDAAWRLAPARSLVKVLALAAKHRLHREQLLEQLWPDLTPAAATNALHQALYAARRALQPDVTRATASTYLRLDREVLTLRALGGVSTDVDRFERAAHEARLARDLASHQAALAVYGGELLPEDRYAEWAIPRRDALRALWHRLLTVLC